MEPRRRHDRRLDVARAMPALPHSRDGEAFDIRRSDAARWLVGQPEIMAYVFDKAKQYGLIEYDSESRTWKGAGSR